MVSAVVVSQVYVADDLNYKTVVAFDNDTANAWEVRFPHKLMPGDPVKVQV